ncbi:serine/threonine-protein kinase [Streptomyces sp. NBC_00091]|uniref:serine/threonine-protein kinase n=1 Tax=Streptomyces sp. NBC_00091 TaxID=2975648 RepID=UPI002253A3F0|nr:serine/threonine-protein kinase [Streptomyces sp. NBC_00091]MCX5375059.1 serine/threonine protein kinase [Streptomyces sp. NBC_00091]
MPHTDQPVLKPLGPDDPTEVAGYQLLARIGEGGMGSVYLTRTRGEQPVALKLIRREFAQDAHFRARFEAEVQAARRVSGYHIVPVLDHNMNGDQPWIATSYVPGLALDEALAAFGPLPLPAALQLIGCTARALVSVHAASVIHRDLKPSNILLSSQGPWVIDFGIARATDTTQLTQTGGFIGTPQYMSPEHALGREVTPATDVFALGLIAAVVATGRHPYGDGSGLSIAAQIANTQAQPPDLSGYPDHLRPLLQACLAADPAARPTPAALADWCQQASGRQLPDFDDWLPPRLAGEIARREQAAQQPPPRPGAQPPAQEQPQPVPPSHPHQPAYVPTQAAPNAASRPHQGAYAPTQTATPPPPTPHLPPARRAGANRKTVIIGGLAVALALTAGGAWVLTRDGEDKRGYRAAEQSKPISLTRKSLIDFIDIDKGYPKANYDDGELSMSRSKFAVTGKGAWGKSTGATPEQCADSVKKSDLSKELAATELYGASAAIVQGDLLCLETSGGYLAMLKITAVIPRTDDITGRPGATPDYKAELTLWEQPS